MSKTKMIYFFLFSARLTIVRRIQDMNLPKYPSDLDSGCAGVNLTLSSLLNGSTISFADDRRRLSIDNDGSLLLVVALPLCCPYLKRYTISTAFESPSTLRLTDSSLDSGRTRSFSSDRDSWALAPRLENGLSPNRRFLRHSVVLRGHSEAKRFLNERLRWIHRTH